MPLDVALLHEALTNARRKLLDSRGANGCWEGELSSSALATATAVFTLILFERRQTASYRARMIDKGLRWLAETQNADGGWGDTVMSFSNVSTTALCWAALTGSAAPDGFQTAIARAETWLKQAAGALEPGALARTIVKRYGKDHTFSVPILTMVALAGRLGEGRSAWRWVPQLPFELAACPYRWFQWLRLPVVSYALPALIAIGQARHHHRPTWNPLTRLLRRWTKQRTLKILETIQPPSGGFLEATPLASFVTMSLIASGQAGHPVVRNGIAFLEGSARPDGSWPIDTNLATWVTTLSVNALSVPGAGYEKEWTACDCRQLRDWLLKQQYRVEHPYTHAAPGGWAWTDLSGGVPDGDDTSGALLALVHLGSLDEAVREAGRAGIVWLLNLQNGDGGMPTFCRGWGALPFDRSSADLIAHAILAWSSWRKHVATDLLTRIDAGIERGIRYLARVQRPDGSWAPLWFGNQHGAEVENLTYGTSRIVRLLTVGEPASTVSADWRAQLYKGLDWLISSQNPAGGWGGQPGTPSSIEETAWAMEGLACAAKMDDPKITEAVARGLNYLAEHTANGRDFSPAPIGFYFANLWYFEKLYPLLFTVAALSRLAACSPSGPDRVAD